MKPSLNSIARIFLVAIGIAATPDVFAQNTPLSIRAVQIQSSRGSDGEENFEYRYNTWFNGVHNPNCINFDNVAPNVWHAVSSTDQSRVFNFSASMAGLYDLEVEAWEEDGCGGDCGYNTGCGGSDEAHCGRQVIRQITPNDYVPGNWPNAPNYFQSPNMCGYLIDFLVSYAPPTPTIPASSPVQFKTPESQTYNNYTFLSGNICSETDIKLAAESSVTTYKNHVYYVFEYWDGTYKDVTNPAYCGNDPVCTGGGGGGPIEAAQMSFEEQAMSMSPMVAAAAPEEPGDPIPPPPCCTEPPTMSVPNWRTVPGTTNALTQGALSFNIRTLDGLSNITTNTTVYFRVYAVANGVRSTGSASYPVVINLSPAAPTIGNHQELPSCTVKNTGQINVTGITGIGTYRYVLRSGFNNNAGCVGDACLGHSGDPDGSLIEGSNRVIPNVADGNYTLLISNPGGTSGVCFSYANLTVAPLTDLAIQNLQKSDILCHNNVEGSVSFNTAFGDVSSRQYSLTNGTQNFDPVVNSNVVYSNLPVGNYTVTVNDNGCSPQAQQAFTIIRPKKVQEASYQDAPASCNNPGNGVVQVTFSKTSGTFDTGAPSTANYHVLLQRQGATLPLFDNDILVATFNRNDLAPGNYSLTVTEPGGQVCNAYTKNFTIAPPPALNVSAASIHVTPVTCRGGSTGSFTFTATGGSDTFTFDLTNGPDQTDPTLAEFTGLAAGNYTLRVNNALAGCLDYYIHPDNIPVGEPPPFVIGLTPTDLTCFESSDGSIAVTVQGGTPNTNPALAPYTIALEIRTATNPDVWGSVASLTSLDAGTYRAQITDSKLCPATSNNVPVDQPLEVQTTGVTPTHVVCYGGTGSFAMTASGGTGSHHFEYYNEGDDEFKALTSLPQGDYLLRSLDSRGCKSEDSYYAINGPDEPLDFEFELSEHNGFTNLCHGDNTGAATLTAFGGNDYGFSGYQFTVNNGTFTTLNSFEGMTAGTRSFSVRDGRGCVVNKDIEFTQPTLILPQVDRVQHVDCYGLATGEIEVSATGGLGGHNFQLDTATPVDVGLFTQLVANDYSITVRDAVGCPIVINQAITNLNPQLIINPPDVTDISCFGFDDGKIELNVTGGLGSYTYTINDNEVTNPTEDLAPGTYVVKVTDSKSCVVQTTGLEVHEPELLIIPAVQLNDIKCFGESATIDMSASGGIGTYIFEYSLNGNPFNTFTNTTPLNVGQYHVRVVDSNTCITDFNQPLIVTAPSVPLDYTYVLSDYNGFNVSCNGKDDGYITITPTGGNDAGYSGYTFTSDTRPFQTENLITGLLAGDRLIAVKDARGCVVEKTISLIESISLVASLLEKTDVVCYGASTGELQAKASGGSNVYQYQLNDGEYQDSHVFSLLPANDNYSITARDENGCRSTFVQSIININPQIEIGVNEVIDAKCFRSADGIINLDVTGGVSPYLYHIGNLATLNPAPGLATGTYSITITDAEGCKKDSEGIFVGQPDDLVINNVTLTDIRCLGETGQLAVAASGGTSPYEYQYDRAHDTQNSFTEFTSVTSLPADNYTVRVKDSHGCISLTATETITQPANALDFTYVLSNYNGYNISCYGGYNGHATLSPSGGNSAAYSGYEFTLDARPYSEDQLLIDVYAGNHILAVRDGRGCVVEKNVLFTQSPDQINATVTSITNVGCIEDKTGRIEVLAEGGTSPYKYRFTNGTQQEAPVFPSLGIGHYEIIVADANNCAVHTEASITNIHPEMILSHTATNVSCFDGRDGDAKILVASGGVSPFGYKWQLNNQTTDHIDDLPKGIYAVTVTDSKGCKKATEVPVTQPDAPLSMVVTPIQACYGKSDGVLSFAAAGGTAPYRYSSDNGATYHNSPQLNVPVGRFQVTTIDAKGCLTNSTATVTQKNSRPEPNFIAATKRNALDTLVLSDISVPKPDSIHWSFGNGVTVIKEDQWSPEIRVDEAGNYTVMMEGFFGGCGYILTKSLAINPYDPSSLLEKQPTYKAIESVSVTPNPNRGEFAINVVLNRKYNTTVFVYDVVGVIHFKKQWQETTGFVENVTLNNVPSGVYLLRVITDAGAEDVRIVVNR